MNSDPLIVIESMLGVTIEWEDQPLVLVHRIPRTGIYVIVNKDRSPGQFSWKAMRRATGSNTPFQGVIGAGIQGGICIATLEEAQRDAEKFIREKRY